MLAAVCLLPAAAHGQPVLGAGLVPAQFRQMVDSQGFIWDVNQMGWVQNGTDSCFSQAFMMMLGGNQFRPSNMQMTADGNELVLQGNSFMPGLQVTRRCRVDPKAVGARFTDVFTNSGAAAMQVNVQYYVNCGNGLWQTSVSDSGQINPTSLSKKETGLVLCAMQQNGCPSVAICLAGPSGTVRPSIQTINNGQQFTFSYNLTVPPRKSAAVVYGAAQVRTNAQPDAKAVAAMMQPFTRATWLQDLPADIRQAIVNFGGFGSEIQWEEVGIGKVLASLERNTGPTDILTFGAGTRLKGSADCKAISLETRFGTLKTSLDKIVAIVGARDHSGKAIVVLRDGQALTGTLHVEGFVFTLNSGLQIEAAGERLERLYMRAGPADVEKGALLQTTDGERIAMAITGKEPIALASPWGRFEFPLDDVAWVSAVSDPPGHRVVLRDGTRLFGYLEGGPMKLPTRSFGAVTVSPLDMQAIRGLQSKESVEDPSQLTSPCVVMSGENVLIGRVDLPALHIVASGQSIPVPPGQIKQFHASEADSQGESATFEVELWDGGKIVGKLAEGMLPVRRGDTVRQVPAQDLVEIHVPTPSVSDATQKRIAGLIRDLGSSEFAKRKSARAALLELGALAVPQLNEALQQTSDAEIRRTANAILEELNK